MIKAVFFDFDGVVVNSLNEIYEIYKIIGKELNVSMPGNLKDFRSEFNQDFYFFYKQRNMTDPEIEKANKIFHREIIKINPALFPGIKDVIISLAQKYNLFLISANYTKALMITLEYFEIDKYFTEVVGKEKGKEDVNKSFVFISLINKYKLETGEIAAVGDRTNDFLDAEKAGIRNIIMTEYGWGYDPEIVKSAMFACKPEDIISIIKKIDL